MKQWAVLLVDIAGNHRFRKNRLDDSKSPMIAAKSFWGLNLLNPVHGPSPPLLGCEMNHIAYTIGEWENKKDDREKGD